MKSILKKIYTNLRKKAIVPYTYSEKYVKLDDVYDEIYKAEKEYNEGLHCLEIRNKAIDEFTEKIMEYCSMSAMNRKMIEQIAEEMKGV